MKLLVITNDFLPKVGGANYYVTEIIRRLPRGATTVLTSTWAGADAFDATFPHRVVRWPTRMLLPTPGVRAAVADMVRDEKFDLLLFGASLPLALIGAEMRRRYGVRYATFTHGLELGATRVAPGRAFLRHIGRTASLVTAVSEFARRLLEPHVDSPSPLAIVPSGIEPETFHPDVSVEAVRTRHDLGDGPIVCCVSRLVARKGQDQLIRALPALAVDWPDIRLLIVGAGSYRSTLERLAARCSVSRRVVFAGEVPYAELPAYFRVGDVFAMPCRSRYAGLETEALGAVYLQASAVGRPCIAGQIGGVPEAVRHDDTGLVVDGTRLREVEQALRVLVGDPQRAHALGQAGAAWVHRELTWDMVAARVDAMLTACGGSDGATVDYARGAAVQR